MEQQAKATPTECLKTRYRTQAEADNDIERIRKTSTRKNIPIRSYYCSPCTAWHMTSHESHVVVQLKETQKELEALKAENKILKDKSRKEADNFSRRDEEVIRLNKTLLNKNKEIKKLMADKSRLINENIQLLKKIETSKTPPTGV